MKLKLHITVALLFVVFAAKTQTYISSSDSVICAGETITLTALHSPIHNWCYWSTGNTVNTPTIVVSPVVNTVYTVNCIDPHASGQSASFTQTVFVCTYLPNDAYHSKGTLYPNPTTGALVISDISPPVKLEVHDSFGSLLFEIVVKEENIKINLSGNKPGIYYISIQGENQKLVRKIVLQ